MGKQAGVCGGRGGSQHICSGGVYSNGIQGGIVPVAAGMALAQSSGDRADRRRLHRRRHARRGGGLRDDEHRVEVGPAALDRLENNRYAQSTPQSQTLAGDIEARAAAFGIVADGPNLEPGRAPGDRRAVRRVGPRGDGPRFLRVDTYRLMAHSKGDDDRDPAEVRAYWDRDPL